MADVEVDKVLGFVGYEASKVLPHNDVPRRAMPSVELLLDLCSDIFLNGVFLESCCGDLHALLLHLFYHINVFDDGLGARGTTVLSG